MTENQNKTDVIFKITPGPKKEVIAFLPDIPANPGNLMSYMHVGQHGEASLDFYLECKPAKPEQYHDLKLELEGIGYELNIIKRRRLSK